MYFVEFPEWTFSASIKRLKQEDLLIDAIIAPIQTSSNGFAPAMY